MKEKVVVAVTSALITTAIIGLVSSIQPAWVIAMLGGATEAELNRVDEKLGNVNSRLEGLAVGEGGELTINGQCYKPRQLIRCHNRSQGDHMTWVDNLAECSGAGLVNEGQVIFLGECS